MPVPPLIPPPTALVMEASAAEIVGDMSALANLPAGTVVSTVGIYVVSHDNPPHTSPHEVPIAIPMILPKCKVCADVRFSLKTSFPERITENLFLQIRPPRTSI